ncbi:VanZ family protein [Virgibacillus salinus]|uniref:VanZ like family protein n=1 Tax=Virgibacillus salinus TaxID=553311 RepID=A0A1H0ZBT7_9BACI|nr:VanZ family protein [Virgibacillus salinus]SDQ24864.1 VanZ like family protein [Virgibacillus salinus]
MKKYFFWLLPISWMGIIYYSSAQPYEDQDVKPLLTNMVDLSFLTPFVDWISFTYHHSEVSVAVLGTAGFVEFFLRKGAHVGVFFVLMCLFYIALNRSCDMKFRSLITISFCLTVAYAGLDEFHQGFTANRTPYLGDVVLDGVGAALATICLMLVKWKTATK